MCQDELGLVHFRTLDVADHGVASLADYWFSSDVSEPVGTENVACCLVVSLNLRVRVKNHYFSPTPLLISWLWFGLGFLLA